MNRKYSQEFKQGAVEQANQPGVTLAQVAKELGLNQGPTYLIILSGFIIQENCVSLSMRRSFNLTQLTCP